MRRAALVTVLAAAVLAVGSARVRSATPVKAAAGERICGIAWETSLEAAKARAAREGKPIFLLHLMGRLDEEFC